MPISASLIHRSNKMLGARMAHSIKVTVAGGVTRQGDYILPFGASVGDAIAAAKGFAKKPLPPAGVVTLRSRRKRDGRYYKRRGFDFRATGMNSIPLRDEDLMIIQYDVNA